MVCKYMPSVSHWGRPIAIDVAAQRAAARTETVPVGDGRSLGPPNVACMPARCPPLRSLAIRRCRHGDFVRADTSRIGARPQASDPTWSHRSLKLGERAHRHAASHQPSRCSTLDVTNLTATKPQRQHALPALPSTQAGL